MADIYDIRRWGRAAFLVTAAAVVAAFLWLSSGLVHDLAAQERERMQIWADATKQIASMDDDSQIADIDFLLSILERNTTIPVLLTDGSGHILQHRNFDLPDAQTDPWEPLTPANEAYLNDKLRELGTTANVINIVISPTLTQHLYYEDSLLLRRLSYYPYVQLLVMLVFVFVVYLAVLSTKKAEQNKVWVGLSKETAHQLGTPISSLMAWMEILRDSGVDPDMVDEMDKDVRRLETIASRFSKIGSRPALADDDLYTIAAHAVDYMRHRISRRITLALAPAPGPMPVRASGPLLEWVLENLVKNAVDAMGSARGTITLTPSLGDGQAVLDVADTGKGMTRKQQKKVFNPGFTTKSRGWGLGLTLARRIVQQYHLGRVWVLRSAPGRGTTFRITLPLAKKPK